MTDTSIIFLGSEIGDAAVRRRVRGLCGEFGVVHAFAFKRTSGCAGGIQSLGRARDGGISARLFSMLTAAGVLIRQRKKFSRADIFFARNLDLLLVALAARSVLFPFRKRENRPKVFYEVLDIHPLLSGSSLISRIARRIECAALRHVGGVIVSAPQFDEAYFQAFQNYRGPVFLLENKLDLSGAPLAKSAGSRVGGGPITLAYVGKLRCRRSLEILHHLAQSFPDNLKVKLAGTALPELADALERLSSMQNVANLGRYRYPDDLSDIYSDCDLVWSVDFVPGLNARLLIPNRLYEGAYFGVPSLTKEFTGADRRAHELGVGMSIPEPFEDNLFDLFSKTPREFRERLNRTVGPTHSESFYVTDDYARLRDFLMESRNGVISS